GGACPPKEGDRCAGSGSRGTSRSPSAGVSGPSRLYPGTRAHAATSLTPRPPRGRGVVARDGGEGKAWVAPPAQLPCSLFPVPVRRSAFSVFPVPCSVFPSRRVVAPRRG